MAEIQVRSSLLRIVKWAGWRGLGRVRFILKSDGVSFRLLFKQAKLLIGPIPK